MESCQVPNFFEATRACFPTHSDQTESCGQMKVRGVDADLQPYVIATLVLLGLFDIWGRNVIQSYRSAHDIIWHSFIFVLVIASGYMDRWGLAVVMAVFAMTWVRLPVHQSNAGGRLPSFETFIKSLSNADSTPNEPPMLPTADTTESNTAVEEVACIVCWSSETSLKILPCKHIICADCLVSISTSPQNHCPLCRLPLFTHSNVYNAMVCRVVAAVWNADAATGLLIAAIHLYHRTGRTYHIIFHGGRAVYQISHALFGRYVIRQAGGDWWQTSIIFASFNKGPLWVSACSSATVIGNLLNHIIELEHADVVINVCR